MKADEIDWSVTTWEGNRRRQHQEYYALPFRRKLELLEEGEAVARMFRGDSEHTSRRRSTTDPSGPR